MWYRQMAHIVKKWEVRARMGYDDKKQSKMQSQAIKCLRKPMTIIIISRLRMVLRQKIRFWYQIQTDYWPTKNGEVEGNPSYVTCRWWKANFAYEIWINREESVKLHSVIICFVKTPWWHSIHFIGARVYSFYFSIIY